jgi:hypothetical protein
MTPGAVEALESPGWLAAWADSCEMPIETAEQIMARALRPDYGRWLSQVEGCGGCSHPIRLKGAIRDRDGQVVYTTTGEPDRILLKRCGNRRIAVCPACSHEYAGDMWQLLCAGLGGGRKGLPATVAQHPMAFVTLTAPSFGAVHSAHGGQCRPRRDHPRCPHGRPLWCRAKHRKGDPETGSPLCAECYDYDGAVLFNWSAPSLWQRFAIALRRALAAQLGVPTRQLCRLVRVSFAKVAEPQARQVVHFHAIIRLDRPGPGWQAPDLDVTIGQLEAAVRTAAAKASVTIAGRALHWGTEVDVQAIRHQTEDLAQGELTAETVAAYITKYVCKWSGGGLAAKVNHAEAARRVGLPDHVVAMMEACERLAASAPGLGRWVHMLGFRGHYASKSRQYSTTLGAIRGERIDYARRQAAELRGEELDETVLLVGEWDFAGIGYLTSGDERLAVNAGDEARAAWFEWRADRLE